MNTNQEAQRLANLSFSDLKKELNICKTTPQPHQRREVYIRHLMTEKYKQHLKKKKITKPTKPTKPPTPLTKPQRNKDSMNNNMTKRLKNNVNLFTKNKYKKNIISLYAQNEGNYASWNSDIKILSEEFD